MGFTIDKVSWHTKTEGNPETYDEIIQRFWSVTDFLQRNNLVVENLIDSPSGIDEDFSIHSDDLTDKGLLLMKQVYDKWLSKLDNGLQPNDLSMFEKALLKL